MAPNPVRTFKADQLQVQVYSSQEDLSESISQQVHAYLKERIQAQGSAAAILATGNSQIKFLARLVALGGIDWSKVTLFHMDEYLGITPDHKASFRYYMRERVESLVKPKAFHYLQGEAQLPFDECERYTALLKQQPIDLCCLGIGENGHLAFNDPPVADFNDRFWVKVLKLDDACKTQQMKEGHFATLEAVPPYAFSLTIPALVSAKRLYCVAPEKRKAVPVKNALEGPISTDCPASILRKQAHCTLMLDQDSSAFLSK